MAPVNRPSAVYDHRQCISACLDDIQCIMQSNSLQWNAIKSELLWCATAHRQHELLQSTFKIEWHYHSFNDSAWPQHFLLNLTSMCCHTYMYRQRTVLAGAPRTVTDKLHRVECCCACRHRHLEVWTRPGLDTAGGTSLARRSWPGVFQVGNDSSPVSEWLRIAITVGLLCSGSRCSHSVAPAFRQPSNTCSSLVPAEHLRPSGLFSCPPHSLELCRISSRTWSDCFICLLKMYLFTRY